MNRQSPPPPASVAAPSQLPPLEQALVHAERTGAFPSTAWPALRDLLLASTDPSVLSLVASLRAWMQAHQALTDAYQDFERGVATLRAAQDVPLALAETASHVSLLAEELAARARQLAALEREPQ